MRENVIVGNGVVMGNSCEFKNCILFDEAQVPHFNYVGDSILGYHAHLGRRRDSFQRETRSSAKLRSAATDGNIATGLTKFGAIVGDRTEIGCNAVINPGLGPWTRLHDLSRREFSWRLEPNSIVKVRQEIQVLDRRQLPKS